LNSIRNFILVSFFLCSFSGNLFSQTEIPEVLVINYIDSIDLSESTLIKEIRIKRKIFNKPYEKLVEHLIDSTKTYGGNCLKINYFDDGDTIHMEKNWKWPIYLKASIHDLDASKRDRVFQELQRIENELDSIYENRTEWQKFFNVDPIKKAKEKKLRKEEAEEFFKSIETDSIKKGIFEIGGLGGMDYLICMNINLTAGLYVFNGKSNKLSINYKTGFLMCIGGNAYYQYPALKYHRRISNHWITASLGREFDIIYSRSGQEKHKVDYRVDVGLKMYKQKNLAMEIYFPLRINNVRIDSKIPIYFTGPSMNWTYLF